VPGLSLELLGQAEEDQEEAMKKKKPMQERMTITFQLDVFEAMVLERMLDRWSGERAEEEIRSGRPACPDCANILLVVKNIQIGLFQHLAGLAKEDGALLERCSKNAVPDCVSRARENVMQFTKT